MKGRKSKFVSKRGFPFQLMKFAEAKQADIQQTIILGSVGAITRLNPFAIGRGTGATSRIGNIIQVSGYYSRWTYQSDTVALVQFWRVTVYQNKKEAQGTDVPATDMVNVPDPRKFIIWDDRTLMVPNAVNGNGKNGVMIMKKRFKPYLKVEYDSATNTDISRGNIWVQMLSNDPGADHVTLNVDWRTYFRDV